MLPVPTAAKARGAQEIWIGVNAIDYSGYPDCRPDFIEAFQQVILRGTKSGLERGEPRIVAPLIEMTKADIIREGALLKVPFHLTHSCYDPPGDGTACGRCDSCRIRREGFMAAGISDPIAYADA